MEDLDTIQLVKKIQQIFDQWLNSKVRTPAFETIKYGLLEQTRIANAVALLNTLIKFILNNKYDIDLDYLQSLPKNELSIRFNKLNKFIENCNKEEYISNDIGIILKDGVLKKHLCLYVDREIHVIVLLIMATSYISAMILIRSTFELLIGIATRTNGPMKNKINSVVFFLKKKKMIYLKHGMN